MTKQVTKLLQNLTTCKVITVDESLFLDQWRWGDRKSHYLNNVQFEKVMIAVRTNLAAEAIRSVLEEEKRRED